MYTELSEMHLAEEGLRVEWADVDVPQDPERWGKRRKYFSQPLYRMPVVKWADSQ